MWDPAQFKEAEDVQNKLIADLHETDRKLRADHVDALRASSEIRGAFPPLDDIVANMKNSVDDVCRRREQAHVYGILRAFGGHLEEPAEPGGAFVAVRPQLYRPPSTAAGGLSFEDLCCFAPDVVKARLEAIIRASGVPAGISLADRPKAVEEADKRIADIEAQHTAFCDSAARVGLTIALLEPVRQRREVERARAENDARAQAARRELEAEVDHVVARGGGDSRFGKSSYLDAQRPR